MTSSRLTKLLVINQGRMCATFWLQSVVMTRHVTCPLNQFFIYLCINSSACAASSSDQSYLTWLGPYALHQPDVSSTISFSSLLSNTLQEATNSNLDYTLLDNKFLNYSAGKHETSAHPLNIL